MQINWQPRRYIYKQPARLRKWTQLSRRLVTNRQRSLPRPPKCQILCIVTIHPLDTQSSRTKNYIPQWYHKHQLKYKLHLTPSRRARATPVSRRSQNKFWRTARGRRSAYLYFLRGSQLGEHGCHALSLCVSNGPKSISRICANDEAGHVGGDKAQTGTAC